MVLCVASVLDYLREREAQLKSISQLEEKLEQVRALAEAAEDKAGRALVAKSMKP